MFDASDQFIKRHVGGCGPQLLSVELIFQFVQSRIDLVFQIRVALGIVHSQLGAQMINVRPMLHRQAHHDGGEQNQDRAQIDFDRKRPFAACPVFIDVKDDKRGDREDSRDKVPIVQDPLYAFHIPLFLILISLIHHTPVCSVVEILSPARPGLMKGGSLKRDAPLHVLPLSFCGVVRKKLLECCRDAAHFISEWGNCQANGGMRETGV